MSSVTKKKHFCLDSKRQQILPNNNLIDWNRGVIFQLPLIASNYIEWIEHPTKNNIQIRMFDSSLLESLSFTPWWVVPALYIPWSFLEFTKSITDFQLQTEDKSQMIHNILGSQLDDIWLLICISSVIYAFGIIGWTLFEYFCHRVIFHLVPNEKSVIQLCMHFLGMHYISY